MLIIPAILETFSSLKDKTLKIVFSSNELNPEQLLGVAKNVQNFGFLAFKQDAFKQTEIDTLKDLDSKYEDKGKSKSKRLKSVLFVSYKQDNKGYEVFDDYYNFIMEKIIEHYKNKLD